MLNPQCLLCLVPLVVSIEFQSLGSNFVHVTYLIRGGKISHRSINIPCVTFPEVRERCFLATRKLLVSELS